MTQFRLISIMAFSTVFSSLTGCSRPNGCPIFEWRAIRNTPGATEPEISVFASCNEADESYLPVRNILIMYPGMKPTLIELVAEDLKLTKIHLLDANGKAHLVPVRLDKLGYKAPAELLPLADAPMSTSIQN